MSSEYLASLRAKREHAWEAQKALLDTIATEGRDITPEEREQVERMDADYDAYAAEEKRVADRLALVAATDALRADLAPRVETARAERRDASDAEMLRRMFREKTGEFESRPSNGFGQESRALGIATASVPVTFYDAVTVYERTFTPMLNGSIVTILNTPTGEAMTMPQLTADVSVSGTLTAEAGGITESDPTLASVTLNTYKYGITNLWSAELDIDNGINLMDLVARTTARSLAIAIGGQLTTADGSSKPNGIVNAATNGGTANGTAAGTSLDTFIAAADLIDLKYGRAEPYRQVGAWMVSNTMLAKMRKFRDSTGQFLWNSSIAAGAPPTFDGDPVYENPGMAAVASASKSVLYGDFSRYFVRRCPIRVDLSRDYKFSTDQLALRTIERVDGDLLDTIAVAYLVSANT